MERVLEQKALDSKYGKSLAGGPKFAISKDKRDIFSLWKLLILLKTEQSASGLVN